MIGIQADIMGFKTRLFGLLWIPGIIGVLSFLLVDLNALIMAMPNPTGEEIELPPPAILKLVSILQPAVIMTVAIFVGVRLAGRVGLHSPAAEALACGGGFLEKLKPQIVPGILTGLASGAALIFLWITAKPFLPPDFIVRAEEFNKFIPAAVRLLYGGITEELLLRWGVMSFLVWASWRIVKKGTGIPGPVYFIVAIAASAILFGVGHLPVASALAGELTAPIVIYVIVGNSLFGLVAGVLYWKKGLEAAMIAHMFAHVVIITAIAAGA